MLEEDWNSILHVKFTEVSLQFETFFRSFYNLWWINNVSFATQHVKREKKEIYVFEKSIFICADKNKKLKKNIKK